MTTRRIPWLALTVLTMVLLAGGAVRADDPSAENAGAPPSGGLADLLKLVGSPGLPSLSGLIQPERMGLLTDNQCHMHDNEAELELLSDNVTNVLSGNRIFSGITVTVNIHVCGNDDESGDLHAKKPDRKAKADKSRKRKASGKSKDR